MDISIAAYSFHGLFGKGAMNVFQYMETIKYRYNCDNADIWNGMLASYDEDYLKLVRAELDERELRLVNLCCDGCHIWGGDEGATRALHAKALDCINAGKILGAKTVRIDVGIPEPDATDEQVEEIAHVYDEYCKLAAEYDAKLGPENHWGASNNVNVMRKLFQAVKAENFGLLLHVGNWENTPGIGVGVTAEDRILHNVEFSSKAMHAHAMYEICEQPEKQLLPIMKAGFRGSLSIECHKATNEYRNVAFQLAQVRRVLTPYNY